MNAFSPPELSAVSAILMDAESGRVLFEKNAYKERAIASITKLMTALVAAESGHKLSEKIVIRPEWTGIEGSSIYLRTGETVTLEILLYGLLLNSGNDAAVAVASYCAGSIDMFVEQMNQRASSLGMKQTHFTNPNGLSESDHFSTAYDMALLARACSANRLISEIVSTKSITLGTRTFTNHNKLLWRYEGCTGMKTGFTEAAGRTLVSSARRNGQTLIAVTLNAPNDWIDHASLFDYGFDKYNRSMLCSGKDVFCYAPVHGSLKRFIPIVTEKELYFPLSDDETIQTRIELDIPINAPVENGAHIGKLLFYFDNKVVAETDLLASEKGTNDIAMPKMRNNRLFSFLNSLT